MKSFLAVGSIGVDPIDARLHANSDQQHLRSACRYIELGMFAEAQAELEEIDPFCRDLPEVLAARIPFYRALEKWDLMAIVAKKLTEWRPEEPGNFIDWAYAARRGESIHRAHAILTRAAGLHPTDAAIQFNLACCESQLGNLDPAKTYLKRAIEIEAKYRLHPRHRISIACRATRGRPLPFLGGCPRARRTLLAGRHAL